jgi:hypothetical protein
MSDFHPSTVDAIKELRTRYPDAPFLTLGQTVLWDEPLKAAFCRLLEALAPEALIVAGVHDTDYFAKLSHLKATTPKSSSCCRTTTAPHATCGAQPAN